VVPAIFSDHMVLQKDAAVPIWGKADPGEQVTVSMSGQTVQAAAGSDGKWKLLLDLEKLGAGPFELTVAGKNRVVISDVVVGQTWLLSGQSNAEFMLKESADAPAEIARSADPLLRQFKVEKKTSDAPREETKGAWVLAGPQGSPEFSAVGYYFAKQLRAELKQPVGIVNASWGGTFIEAWMSDAAIDGDPELRAGETARRREMENYQPAKAAYVKAYGDWLKANGREDRPCPDPRKFTDDAVSTGDWTPIQLPGPIVGANLPANGAIWIRKEIEVPASVEGLVIKLSLGNLTAFEETYWNGEKIFEMPYTKFPGEGYAHYFAIPQRLVRPGKAVIAIRLFAPVAAPEMLTPASRLYVGPVSLQGEWRAKAEYDFPSLPVEAIAHVPKPPRQPPALKASGIFNGVLNPIVAYGIAGVLWYQGESNTGIAGQYRTSFPLLIQDLRAKWNRPELPFYFCQLANHQAKEAVPVEAAWAELRESQSRALALPHTGQAVLIDLGESEDIHPRNKAEVGARLARIALARDYGRSDLAYSGPCYTGLAVEGSRVRLHFTQTAGGLVAKPLPKTYDVKTLLNQTAPLRLNSPESELQGFAICGTDRHWVWAQARIEGDDVFVWSEQVTAPVAVRYGWANNPTVNLYNQAGLPASPFRSDDFPTTTDACRFGLTPQGRF